MFNKQLLSLTLLAVISFSLVGVLAMAAPAGAQAQTGVESILDNTRLDKVTDKAYGVKDASAPGASDRKIENYVVLIINSVLGLLGIIFLILIIYAGFLWMTAGGNDEQVGKAKGLLTNAIIGVVIIVAAYAISFFVLNALIN